MDTQYMRDLWGNTSPKIMSYSQKCDMYDEFFTLLDTVERLQTGLQHIVQTASSNKPLCNKIERMKRIAELTVDGKWPTGQQVSIRFEMEH